MSKRLFLLVLVAALLMGGPAMGQIRNGKSHSRKAKIEQKRKRPSVKSSKKTVEESEEILASGEVAELVIVDDERVKADEIKTKDELKETETAFGQKKDTILINPDGRDHSVTRTLRPENATLPENLQDSDPVFRSVEQMPQFPGGEAALMKYIQSHINYPPMAAENEIEGKVIVQFVVKKDGSIGQVKVVRSVDKDLDEEAVRLIKALPKFTPGRQNGQAVNVWYTLPVTFKLKKTQPELTQPVQ